MWLSLQFVNNRLWDKCLLKWIWRRHFPGGGGGGGSQGKGSVVAFVVIFLTWRSQIRPRVKVLWGRVYGVSSLSEKTRKSNYLHMSEQRQHVLLSYFYTLSADLRYTAPNGNTHTVIHCKLYFKLSQWKPQLRDN